MPSVGDHSERERLPWNQERRGGCLLGLAGSRWHPDVVQAEDSGQLAYTPSCRISVCVSNSSHYMMRVWLPMFSYRITTTEYENITLAVSFLDSDKVRHLFWSSSVIVSWPIWLIDGLFRWPWNRTKYVIVQVWNLQFMSRPSGLAWSALVHWTKRGSARPQVASPALKTARETHENLPVREMVGLWNGRVVLHKHLVHDPQIHSIIFMLYSTMAS